MHALSKKRPDMAAHLEHVVWRQDNAHGRTARNMQLEINLVWSQRAFNPPYSLDLATMDFAYWRRIYLEHEFMIELTSVMRYKNSSDHYTVIGSIF